jgi:hypothetical protein
MALSDVAQRVYDQWKQTEADIARLTQVIARQNLEIAGDELRRLDPDATLRTSQIRAIERAARQSARSIVYTYNTDLLRKLLDLDPARPDRPARNTRQLNALLRRWETERDAWKVPQIAAQEQVTTRRAIFETYIDDAELDDALVEWIPKRAAEDYCQHYVDRGPMPVRDAIKALERTHIGCVHTLHFVERTTP